MKSAAAKSVFSRLCTNLNWKDRELLAELLVLNLC